MKVRQPKERETEFCRIQKRASRACATPYAVLEWRHHERCLVTERGWWRYVYYKDASGKVPVREFIAAQEAKVREKIFADLERLVRENVRLGPPFARKLSGRDFWELRTKAPGGDIYRTFYFAFTGRKFVLLHAFHKKSQKTPLHDLELAERRMADYLKRAKKRKSGQGKR